MAKNESEIWKALPGVPGIEVSMFGNVRTLDKLVSNGRGTWLMKGRVLKPASDEYGYLHLSIKVGGKWATKKVHRLVALAFIPNPDGLPEINHKDNNPLNNSVSNLEWCTRKYNVAYREKYGIPAKYFRKSPVYAVNLATLEVSQFTSQHEASRVLGLQPQNVNAVIKGRIKSTGGFWFTKDDANAADAIKHKLEEV